jgi:ERCC4-type nuclease
VELKALGDAVRCMRDGRAAEQLVAMRRSYAASYLVVEGNYRCGPGGAIEVPIGGFWDTPAWARHASYRGLRKWILSMELNGGAHVRETRFPADTLGFIAALAEWWQEGRASHRSHLAPDTAFQTLSGDDWVALGPAVSRAVLMTKVLPGLGTDRAKAAVEHFGGATLREKVQRVLDADKKAWKAVPGVGKVTAQEVLAALEAPE